MKQKTIVLPQLEAVRDSAKTCALWELKMEGVLEFDPRIHQQTEPFFQSDSGNTIRFRQAAGKGETEGESKIESNARMVKWSDGSWQLVVGRKLYSLQESSAKNAYLYKNLKETEVTEVEEAAGSALRNSQDLMLHRGQIKRKLIPTLAKEEDALQFAMLVKRKSSSRLKIQTEELTGPMVQKQEVMRFQSFPVQESSMSNSNTLERIRELQRKNRPLHERYEDDFIDDDEEDQEEHYKSSYRRTKLVIEDDQSKEPELGAGDEDSDEDEEDYQAEQQRKKKHKQRQKQKYHQREGLLGDGDSEDDQEDDEEDQEGEGEGDEEEEDEEEEESEAASLSARPIRRSRRLNRDEKQQDIELQSLNSDLVREINKDGEEQLIDQSEEEEPEAEAEAEAEEVSEKQEEAQPKKTKHKHKQKHGKGKSAKPAAGAPIGLPVGSDDEFDVDDVIAEVGEE